MQCIWKYLQTFSKCLLFEKTPICEVVMDEFTLDSYNAKGALFDLLS